MTGGWDRVSDVWKHSLLELMYQWGAADKSRWSRRQRGERDNEIVCSSMCPHLFVSLQLLHEGTLVEEAVQTLLSVVMAQVLKGRTALTLSQPWVLKAWCVHDEQRAQRVLAGFQGPGAHQANAHIHKNISSLLLEATFYRLHLVHMTLALSSLQHISNLHLSQHIALNPL